MNKTKSKNLIESIGVTVITLGISLFLLYHNIIDMEGLVSSTNNFEYDFQYNIIQTSAIIAGFLFSGVSILISAIDKDRIKRLWNYNYLDNLYVFAFEGMISNIVTIVCAILILIFSLDDKIKIAVLYIEVISLNLGIVSFVVCIKYLLFIIRRLKDGNTTSM